jgi:hypothetical protein
LMAAMYSGGVVVVFVLFAVCSVLLPSSAFGEEESYEKAFFSSSSSGSSPVRADLVLNEIPPLGVPSRWLGAHHFLDGQLWVTNKGAFYVLPSSTSASIHLLQVFPFPQESGLARLYEASHNSLDKKTLTCLLVSEKNNNLYELVLQYDITASSTSLVDDNHKWELSRILSLPTLSTSDTWKHLLLSSSNVLLVISKERIVALDRLTWTQIANINLKDDFDLPVDEIVLAALYDDKQKLVLLAQGDSEASHILTFNVKRGGTSALVLDASVQLPFAPAWNQFTMSGALFQGNHNEGQKIYWINEHGALSPSDELISLAQLFTRDNSRTTITPSIALTTNEQDSAEESVIVSADARQPGWHLHQVKLPSLSLGSSSYRFFGQAYTPEFAVEITPTQSGEVIIGTQDTLTTGGLRLLWISYPTQLLSHPSQQNSQEASAYSTYNSDYDPSHHSLETRKNSNNLPFSCHIEGCGPDVPCPNQQTTNCYLYQGTFLCCVKSPLGF